MIRAMLGLLPPQVRRGARTFVLLAVLGVALRAIGAVLLVPIVSRLLGDDPSSAWPWVGLLAASTVVGWIVDAGVARRGFDLGFTFMDRAQHSVADQLAQVRLGWFDADNTATARQAVSANGPALVGLVIYLVTPLLGAVLLPFAIALALIPISWQLALAALGGVPVLLLAFWAALRISRSADREAARQNVRLTERLIEFARTQPVLRASRRSEPERSLAGAALASQHSSSMKLLRWQIPAQLLFSIATQIALLLLAGTTTALAVNDTITNAEAIALIAVIARYLEPFTTLTELSAAIDSTVGMLRQIRTVLDAPIASRKGADFTPGRTLAIELENVSFSYDGNSSVLEGLDLQLKPGSTTAIVGPSGSGKSTILALLAGLQAPTGGRVLVNGTDLAALSADDRRSLVSVVFQEPYLFDGTIRENVLVGRPDADARQLKQAVSIARVAELAERLPLGLDAPVGEAGGALSGGERQRVSIARALVKQAPLLLVDEATSALDTENEAAVVEALRGQKASQTRVVVAHRLASIRTADRILFLENGQIVEDGSITALLKANGRFASFWKQQEASSAWQLNGAVPAKPKARTKVAATKSATTTGATKVTRARKAT